MGVAIQLSFPLCQEPTNPRKIINWFIKIDKKKLNKQGMEDYQVAVAGKASIW